MDPDVSTLIDELLIHVPQWMNEHRIDGFSVAVTGKTGGPVVTGIRLRRPYGNHGIIPATATFIKR